MYGQKCKILKFKKINFDKKIFFIFEMRKKYVKWHKRQEIYKKNRANYLLYILISLVVFCCLLQLTEKLFYIKGLTILPFTEALALHEVRCNILEKSLWKVCFKMPYKSFQSFSRAHFRPFLWDIVNTAITHASVTMCLLYPKLFLVGHSEFLSLSLCQFPSLARSLPVLSGLCVPVVEMGSVQRCARCCQRSRKP